MLQLSASFTQRPILSLRTGGQIATAVQPIINPNNLKIEGFYCLDRFDKKQLVLMHTDIRDFTLRGIIVNDHEVLSDPADLVRMKDVLKLNFQLLGKPVVTISKRKLGKVNDFAADTETLYVQKIYVGQSLIKSFSGGQLGVERTQITEITNQKIVIQDPLQGVKAGSPAIA